MRKKPTTMNKALGVAALLAFALVSVDGLAQVPGGRDPWGWRQQSNEDGMRQACNGLRQQYNTIVRFYNASTSERERRQYWEHLQQLKEEMQIYCR